MKNDFLLLLPNKPDEERDALAGKWAERYGEVRRISEFWIKPDIKGKQVALYGYDSFCLVLAQILDLQLISPKDELIGALEPQWIKRKIAQKQLGNAADIAYPSFVKPVIPKLFRAAIYHSKEELGEATKGIKSEEEILISTVISIETELRVFVLNKEIKDLACYEGAGNIEEARTFAQDFLFHTQKELPITFVMDLGYNKTNGWFIIEFNSSWGAGLNGCNPDKVLDCIKAATVDKHSTQPQF